jgi:hypothetical protein
LIFHRIPLPGLFELLFELPHTESRMESWNGILHQKGGKKKKKHDVNSFCRNSAKSSNILLYYQKVPNGCLLNQ